MGILRDIKSGALPASELPRFALWLMGRAFWPLFCLILGAALGLLVR